MPWQSEEQLIGAERLNMIPVERRNPRFRQETSWIWCDKKRNRRLFLQVHILITHNTTMVNDKNVTSAQLVHVFRNHRCWKCGCHGCVSEQLMHTQRRLQIPAGTACSTFPPSGSPPRTFLARAEKACHASLRFISRQLLGVDVVVPPFNYLLSTFTFLPHLRSESHRFPKPGGFFSFGLFCRWPLLISREEPLFFFLVPETRVWTRYRDSVTDCSVYIQPRHSTPIGEFPPVKELSNPQTSPRKIELSACSSPRH